MCGIAGFTIAPGIDLERTALARLLLAGIAERGTDATGYGYHRPDGSVEVHKESLRLREFVEHVAVPEAAGEAIFHVRGYTKGVPTVNDNNHPVRYGRAVVVHNGHLDNDDALFRRYGVPRSTPHITVDSEAIAMLADRERRHRRRARRGARERCRGRALGRRARSADARAPRLAPALHRPRRRLRPVRLDRRAAAARGRGHGPARARSRRSARGARSSCATATSSRGRRFHVDRRYVGQALVTYPPLAEKPALLRLALAAF